MKVSSGWDTKHRAWATRKPKVRSEVPCLENPLGARRMTSMEYIRQQAAHMANSWLEEGPRITQGRPPTINQRSRNNAGL